MVAGIGRELFQLAGGFDSFNSGVAANAEVFFHRDSDSDGFGYSQCD
jgi:hypothetical protein